MRSLRIGKHCGHTANTQYDRNYENRFRTRALKSNTNGNNNNINKSVYIMNSHKNMLTTLRDK